MSKFTKAVRRFLNVEQGATMAEYALLIAVVAVVAVAGAKLLGSNTNSSLNSAAAKVAAP